MNFNVEQYRKQGMTREQIIEKLQLVNNLNNKPVFDEEKATQEIIKLEEDIENVQKRLNKETALLKIHADVHKNLFKKFDEEKAKYDLVAT